MIHYRIWKGKDWKKEAWIGLLSSLPLYLIAVLLFGGTTILILYKIINKDFTRGEISWNAITDVLVILFWIWCTYHYGRRGYMILKNEILIRSAKLLKKSWKGIVKHLKVSSIDFVWRKEVSWYYLTFKDWKETYYSDVLKSAKHVWYNEEFLKTVYEYYGYDYKPANKKKVLKAFDEDRPINDGKGLINKLTSKLRAESIEDLRECLANDMKEHLVYKEKEIYIGDSFDVYINPNYKNSYRVDLN